MKKINLNDKYIHSPNWEHKNNLERFQSILKKGYLLTPKETGIKTKYYKDKIFLAVHPNGIFSQDYPGKDIAIFSNTDGYEMASNGLFFILNSKIKEDYDLQPVTYKYECASNSKIDLYKYLEGIGNAGFNIDDKLIYCYYFIKYANDEIQASKIIEIIKERNLGLNLAMAIKSKGKWINSCAIPKYNYLKIVLSNNVEDLLKIDNYYKIIKILEEEKKNLKLYDKYGYLIDPIKRIEEVNDMYKYIEQNKMIQMEDSYFKKIDELCEIVDEKKLLFNKKINQK